MPLTYRLVWPDRAISFVTVGVDAKGLPELTIRGCRHRLLTLFDYKTAGAIAVEIGHIARKAGARIWEENES